MPALTETTHSGSFRFTDGTIVEMFPPNGDDWKSETILDMWMPRRKGQRKPQIWRFEDGTLDISLPSFEIGKNDEEYYAELNHDTAKMVAHEYRVRIDDEEPELIKLTRHTRAMVYHGNAGKESYRNPLPPEPPPTNLWIANHEVVYMGQCKEADTYPGADRRLTDKPWSGVWMDKHAPKIEVK